MSYIFQFLATYWVVAVVVEIVFVAFIVWGFCHEEKFVQFEDKIIRFVIRLFRRQRFSIKAALYKTVRNVFLFFYRPYRRIKARILKRLLCQFGLRAVKNSAEVQSNEILSR